MELNIKALTVTPLKIIEDERGSLMHMLRSDATHFNKFGEIYFSMVRPNVIKAWKRHKKMTLNIAVPAGRVRLIIYDNRANSPSIKPFNEFILGPNDQYALITIPPMMWTGFQNIGTTDALLANCATIPHDPTEADQVKINDPSIAFDWNHSK